ncbi:hypothetical protein [Cytobacillus praedii]|uniref:Uncharacterized protein n=1 Tax=Cytobacillus praedii TaxID=1742358 RepID=A0A4R1AU81_9BACI|nr:hypothetical protein [Cytobacillus praedii]TCJ00490.1 hypothetical protein E0Y62_26645 [Cytobacillus praedii]
MKPTLFGKATVIFSKEFDHTDKNLAYLETGYLVSDEITEKVEIVFTNSLGQRTVFKADDWNTRLLEMYDEDGLPVR